MTTNTDTKPSTAPESGPARLEIRPGVGGEDAKNFSLTLAKSLESYAKGIDPKAQLVKGPTLTLLLWRGIGELDRFGGVHRIQRIPKNSSRRHTSTATVVLLTGSAPVETELADADLKEDFYRASGPGGQHRNVTDTAVRLTHVPTGLVVVAERSRSRAQNREVARLELTRRLSAQAAQSHEESERDSRRSQVSGAGRPSKGWTWNAQRGVVTDHSTGAVYSMAQAERGKF